MTTDGPAHVISQMLSSKNNIIIIIKIIYEENYWKIIIIMWRLFQVRRTNKLRLSSTDSGNEFCENKRSHELYTFYCVLNFLIANPWHSGSLRLTKISCFIHLETPKWNFENFNPFSCVVWLLNVFAFSWAPFFFFFF